MRKYSSPGMVVSKNCLSASTEEAIRLFILALVSSRRPTETGPSSRQNEAIFCSTPSSNTRNRSAGRLVIGRSRESVTVTGTSTTLTSSRRMADEVLAVNAPAEARGSIGPGHRGHEEPGRSIERSGQSSEHPGHCQDHRHQGRRRHHQRGFGRSSVACRGAVSKRFRTALCFVLARKLPFIITVIT